MMVQPAAKQLMPSIPLDERLIVALDVDSSDEAAEIVHALGATVSFYKIGLQLFMTEGLSTVKLLTGQGKKIFLDLKIDDTPRTIEAAVRNMAIEGVRFFTLQGNRDTVRAADRGRGGKPFPKFLQVTYLSSWDEGDLREYYHLPESATLDFDEQVVARTKGILSAGCDGVIASGTSVRRLREAFPDTLIVTPGIRPEGSASDDHKRTLSPGEAIRAGANYVVAGRPIRNARDPKGVARQIQEEIRRVLS